MNLPFWAATANVIRARVVYGARTLDSAATVSATTNMNVAPWLFAPLEMHVCQPGAQVQGGSLTLIGDSMNLLARQVSGDCTIIGHLAALPTVAAPDGSGPPGTEAGIILRGTTNATPGWPAGHRQHPGLPRYLAPPAAPISRMIRWSTAAGLYASGNLGGQTLVQDSAGGQPVHQFRFHRWRELDGGEHEHAHRLRHDAFMRGSSPTPCRP